MAKTESINWETALPLEPPEALWEYEPMKKALDVHALIFKAGWYYEPLEERKVQAAEVHCTACRNVFYTQFIKSQGCHGAGYGIVHPEANEAIESGMTTTCPFCATPVRALHTTAFGSSPRTVLAKAWPMTFHKIEGRFAILTWFVEKWADKNGSTGRWVHPYEAYVADGKKVVKLVGYKRNYYTVQQFGRWERRARCEDTYRSALHEPVLSPSPEVLAGTEMENSKLDLLLREDETFPVSYMQVYLKHQNVENLMMQGMVGMINEMLKRYPATANYSGGYGIQKDLHGIDWKKDRSCEMLRMNKQEFEFFRSNGLGTDDLMKWEAIVAKKALFRMEDLLLLKNYQRTAVEMMLELDRDVMRVHRYLERQKRRYPKDRVGVTELRDYRDMIKRLGWEDDPYPQRLKGAHDRAAEEQNRRKDELKAAGMKKRYAELAKYSFELEGLLIRPARNATEIRVEGKKLHHCVQSYTDRHASGQTAIFFIRKADEPEEPFFTLEFNEKNLTVVQNRGLRNCGRTPEVELFEAAWLEFVKKLSKKEKKGHGKQERNAAGTAA